MTAELIARIRKNREGTIELAAKARFDQTTQKWTPEGDRKISLVFRRPTDIEFNELARRSAPDSEVAQAFVLGWDRVIEDDVVGGGGSDPVAFDALLWREWCADRADFWEPISTAVLNAYRLHAGLMEAAGKNLRNG